ncbi:MAG: uracil phosphoribosyltransferase [Phycisphaerales bacterium JB043]
MAEHDGLPNLCVIDHPLVRDKVTWMRSTTTGRRAFRALVEQIAGLMVYEATRDLRVESVEVETPLETTLGHRLSGSMTVVPVLRAGLGMVRGVVEMLPSARIGHLGLSRDETTLEPRTYVSTLPDDLGAGPVLLLDPMLATGGSASSAASILRERGAEDLRMLCLVGAPEGVGRMLEDHPDVMIYAAVLDERLDERGYIRPGLGDAGDRLFGTGAWTNTIEIP